MPWSRSFDEPIKPPKSKLPWNGGLQEAVIMAAEDPGPLMHAHGGMMLAQHGAIRRPSIMGGFRATLCPVKTAGASGNFYRTDVPVRETVGLDSR
jgi:hypothetical protein